MGIFNSITIRVNSNTEYVEASWWNDIRTALINAFGGGVTGETKFTITDNTSSLTNITDFTFSGVNYSFVRASYTIARFDGTSTYRKESGYLDFNYNVGTETWSLDARRSSGDDALNLGTDSLDVDTTTKVGQVQYKCDSMGGGTHFLTWKIIETKNIEA